MHSIARWHDTSCRLLVSHTQHRHGAVKSHSWTQIQNPSLLFFRGATFRWFRLFLAQIFCIKAGLLEIALRYSSRTHPFKNTIYLRTVSVSCRWVRLPHRCKVVMTRVRLKRRFFYVLLQTQSISLQAEIHRLDWTFANSPICVCLSVFTLTAGCVKTVGRSLRFFFFFLIVEICTYAFVSHAEKYQGGFCTVI